MLYSSISSSENSRLIVCFTIMLGVSLKSKNSDVKICVMPNTQQKLLCNLDPYQASLFGDFRSQTHPGRKYERLKNCYMWRMNVGLFAVSSNSCKSRLLLWVTRDENAPFHVSSRFTSGQYIHQSCFPWAAEIKDCSDFHELQINIVFENNPKIRAVCFSSECSKY